MGDAAYFFAIQKWASLPMCSSSNAITVEMRGRLLPTMPVCQQSVVLLIVTRPDTQPRTFRPSRLEKQLQKSLAVYNQPCP
jgi:hypothetical protein